MAIRVLVTTHRKAVSNSLQTGFENALESVSPFLSRIINPFWSRLVTWLLSHQHFRQLGPFVQSDIQSAHSWRSTTILQIDLRRLFLEIYFDTTNVAWSAQSSTAMAVQGNERRPWKRPGHQSSHWSIRNAQLENGEPDLVSCGSRPESSSKK